LGYGRSQLANVIRKSAAKLRYWKRKALLRVDSCATLPGLLLFKLRAYGFYRHYPLRETREADAKATDRR
jgi:hypothetical protein